MGGGFFRHFFFVGALFRGYTPMAKLLPLDTTIPRKGHIKPLELGIYFGDWNLSPIHTTVELGLHHTQWPDWQKVFIVQTLLEDQVFLVAYLGSGSANLKWIYL